MAQPSISKLTSACTSIVADTAEAMSRNVAKGPEMSRNVMADRDVEKCKTNPIPSRRLSPRQLAGVALLLAGYTALEVARQLRVNPRTVFRWKQDPRFIAEIDRRAAELIPRAAPQKVHSKVAPVAVKARRIKLSAEEDEADRWAAEMTRRTIERFVRPVKVR